MNPIYYYLGITEEEYLKRSKAAEKHAPLLKNTIGMYEPKSLAKKKK